MLTPVKHFLPFPIFEASTGIQDTEKTGTATNPNSTPSVTGGVC